MSQYIETQVARFQKWGFWHGHWLFLVVALIQFFCLLEDKTVGTRFWVDLISGFVFLGASVFWWFKIRLFKKAASRDEEKKPANGGDL